MTFPFGLRSSVQHGMMRVLSKLRKKEEYIILRRSVNEYLHAKRPHCYYFKETCCGQTRKT